MKEIMENWRRTTTGDISNEKARQIVHEHILSKLERLNSPTLVAEATLSIHPQEGVHLSTEFTKWAAISGIATTACVTAVEIAGFSTPWAMFLLSTVPAAATIIASPAGLFLTAGLIFRFPWIRKLATRVLTWLGGDLLKSGIDATRQVIAKMVAVSNGELDNKSAWELFRILAKVVVNNEDFRTKLVEITTAMKEKNEQLIATLSAEFDDLIEKIVREEILSGSDKKEGDKTEEPLATGASSPKKETGDIMARRAYESWKQSKKS